MTTMNGPADASTSTLTTDKNFKRKFEDAIHNLDDAVGPLEPLSANPPPSKKARTGRSLYATLAKYGIKKEPKQDSNSSPDKLESLSKTAPHLAAIIARTTSRARKALPFRFGQPSTAPPSISSAPSAARPTVSPESEYRPSSTTSFLSRLATFKLSTYANKPPAIDAVSASKCGWINDGKDRLVCGICHVSWVVAGKEGMSRDAANVLVEKQRQSLVDNHKDGCPWKKRQCDPSIYRVPLYAPVAMTRELKSRAEKLTPLLKGVEIRHPMTASQVQPLITTVKAVKQPSFSFSFNQPSSSDEDVIMRDDLTSLEVQQDLSSTAVLVALFGWSIPPPSEKPTRIPSVSRANSFAPSASVPQTPVRLVRTASQSASRESTPSPSFARRLFSRTGTSPSASVITSNPKADSNVLCCTLCQRRIGLWAFLSSAEPEDPPTPTPSATPGKSTKVAPRRQFDILKEHRSYCPYVVRSTEIPSMPAYPPGHASRPSSSSIQSGSTTSLNGHPGAVEGWRAVLTIVLRYGAAQRQRFGLGGAGPRAETPLGSTEEGSEELSAEGNEIGAMVAGVKSHGGRELLKYVRTLLG
ncbi:zf-C3HC-domain-containing protein [Cristinia sonorae]|uniref:Zf-C3HC-domain-containing protein n=1 Tax=Cristinia sonorae TaxID=1940300 RepID=A0A8K0XPW1_9AGAR|nr:zf-C3HC-domain-containing protein [Cristinia sonorae]